jgi:TRAP-type transport system periplasmic protein
MQFTRRTGVLSLLASAAVFAAAMGPASAQNRAFSFAYDQPKTTAYGIAGDIFDAKLKELSGGKMSINQFPGAQLGSEPVMLQKMRSGDIDFVITSTANASTVAPQSGVFSLHYIFRDEGHLAKVLADPGITKAFQEMVAETVQGGRVITLMTMGLRNIYSKKEIKSVADLKDVKIRVQATKTEDTHFPAYGTQTVHMPFGEVYTSLQTGVVGAAENGVNVYLANKHYEVAPVLSMTEHEANNNCMWISDKAWNSLSDTEKGWVLAAAAEVGKTEPMKALQLEKDSAEKLKKLGVKVVEGVDKSGFIKAAEPIQDSLAKELGPHAVKILGMVRAIK